MKWKYAVVVVIILVVILLIIYFRRHVDTTVSVAALPAYTKRIENLPVCQTLDLMPPSNLVVKKSSRPRLWNVSWAPNRMPSEYIVEITSRGETQTFQTSRNDLIVGTEEDSDEIDVTVKSINVECDMKSVPITLRSVISGTEESLH